MDRQKRTRQTSEPPSDQRAGDDSNWTAIALVMIWMVSAMCFIVLVIWPQDDASRVVLAALATFPAALILTLALFILRAIGAYRRQADSLQASIVTLRHAVEQTRGATGQMLPLAQSRIDAIAAAQEQTDTRLSLFFSRRSGERGDVNPPAPKDDAEPLLALDDTMHADTPPPTPAELIRALHFPEDENDSEGFDALRKALADSRTSNLIRAAQEVLTHLAQEGIYMDDLRPDRARPEFWRAFAAGTRGTLISPLGGIRDRSCLALTSARMRANAEFKETAHLFLREFDKVFAVFEKDADDAQIAAFSETRSARAFMLLGRVSGVFSR